MIPYKDFSRFGPNIIDMASGYSITIPAIYQMPPFWWEDKPQAYASVQRARQKAGIRVDDWDGGKKPVRGPEPAFYGNEPPEWAQALTRGRSEAQGGAEQ